MERSYRLSNLFIRHWIFILFTVAYFVFAFLTYKDYGVTFDEKVEYDAGKYLLTYMRSPTSTEYVNSLVNDKPNYIEQRHLPLFSVYSRVYPGILNLLNPNYYFEWFHLLNLIFGYFLFLFSYLLFFLVYKSTYKAMLSLVFIAFTATLSGHIPANPKDIPFATTYVLGILAIYFFQSKKFQSNYIGIIVLGMVFGLAQSQRTVGITLFLTYVLFRFIFIEKITFRNTINLILESILIWCVSLVVWIICLPSLGANLPVNFIELQLNSANFSAWNHEIIYFGQYLTREQRPWHYLFVYLLMTLPIFTILSILSGLLSLLLGKLQYNRHHPILLITFLLILNSGIYLLLHPVVYNGIRHFLYLVLCITLIATFLFIDVVSVFGSRIKKLILIVFLIYIFFTAIRLINLHPYEYIYFNEFSGGLPAVVNKFDVEYWGASYKEAAEYIREFVTTQGITNAKLYACDNQFAVVYYSQFKYELVGNSKDADIVICDLHKDRQRHYDSEFPIVKTINRENTAIFNIRTSKVFYETYKDRI